MSTVLPSGPMPDTFVATRDGQHKTRLYNSYVFWAECSCGWKSPARGSHTKAREEAQDHRAAAEKAA